MKPARARVRRIAQVAVPVLIVAAVLAIAVDSGLVQYRGNLAGFVQFGAHFAGSTHPPPGAPINSSQGYDGQFFYLQALDPLLLHDSTVNAMRAAGAGFRMERVAYPALAFLIAGGQPGAIPFALLAINILVLLSLTAGFAVYARRRGWSPFWALAVGLMPGMLLPVLRDLSDPLATASVLAGVLLWRSGRRWPAALALAVAVLTREVMMLAVAAVAFEAGVRIWRSHGVRGAWRAIALEAAPVVGVPAAAFAAWQAYVIARYGGPVGGAALNLPLMNIVDEARASLHTGLPLLAGFDLVYLFLILAGATAAAISLRRRVTVTSAATCALALGVLVPTFGDVWSDTRLSAPFFALLLVDGLHRRDRRSVLIAGAAAAMTLLIPVAIPGSF